ncbi:D-alanyl-D-alanine carboxypeptidase (penicillin-binding protein 5/6) [Gracilibacillus halotolerans]|uniref:serine-type D-Ala-D-Ala carboxypeptidase n=1 Tax=Gracilibacillus halotolerans TaxID=74386 RepID=A0A841RKY2_9BACI|nr:D-alanyl-D-alanine carboxypeptidase family protein [Gracilibacillus halotolerans]MBB6513401.1 D-alanyl-D-alanine carboxypeptidase (penicillin-binding protein 5/6) [Gracilibacillus halotolerans]
MKKLMIGILSALTIIMFYAPLSTVQAETAFNVEAESAIIVDGNTGKILYEKNSDLKLPPASMTKMMTEYLVLEAIAEGKITWETPTQISDYSYSISGDSSSSGIGLTQDKDYTVRELFEAMAIYSDNGTTIALAELIAGSESEFVKMMNEKGEEMGLPEFKFVNSTGLANEDLGENYPEGTAPDDDNLLSARSSALLAYHLLKDYPEVLEFTSKTLGELDNRTLENWNWMLPWGEDDDRSIYGYEGVEGLKTGYTSAAGYCFTGTAKQGDQRIITVVMKTDSEPSRFIETKKLMEFGFSQFEQKELFPAGFQLEDDSEIPVNKGKEKTVEIATQAPFSTMIRTGEEDLYHVEYQIDESKLDEDGNLVAPIEKGEKVGVAMLQYTGDSNTGYIQGNQETQTVDIVTTSAVEKDNWFMLTLKAIGGFFSSIFSSIADFFKGLFS